MIHRLARTLSVLLPVAASALAVQFVPLSEPAPETLRGERTTRVHLNMRRLSLEQQVAEAGSIVRAQVVARSPFVNRKLGIVETIVTVSILDTYKGQHELTLSIPVAGGQHAGVHTRMDYTPELRVGRQYLLFLSSDPNTRRLLGRSDAVYPISLTEDGGARVFGAHETGADLHTFEAAIREMLTAGTAKTVTSPHSQGGNLR